MLLLQVEVPGVEAEARTLDANTSAIRFLLVPRALAEFDGLRLLAACEQIIVD